MAVLSRVAWKTVGALSGILAAKLTRTVLDRTWRSTRGGDPPRNPAAPQTSWGDAVAWAVASGTAMGVARLLAGRGAAAAWQHTTGSLPPGLEEVGA